MENKTFDKKRKMIKEKGIELLYRLFQQKRI